MTWHELNSGFCELRSLSLLYDLHFALRRFVIDRGTIVVGVAIFARPLLVQTAETPESYGRDWKLGFAFG